MTSSIPRRALLAVAVLTSTALVPAAAHAAGTVTLPPDQARQALFVTGGAPQLTGPDADERIVLERVLQQMYKSDPDLSPDTAVGKVQGLGGELRSALGDRDWVDGFKRLSQLEVLDVARQKAAGDPITAKAVREVVEEALVDDAHDHGVGQNAMTASADQLPGDGATFAPVDVLKDTLSLAAGSPDFGAARDRLWESTDHEGVYYDVHQLVTSDPDIQQASVLTGHLDVDGTLTLSSDEAMGIATGAMADANAMLDQARRDAAALADQQDKVKAASDAQRAAEEQKLKELKERVEADAKLREKAIKGAKGVLSGAVWILDKIDPETAATVQSAGNAIIKGAELFNTFSDKAGSIAVNLASGNYLGVVSDVFGLVTGLGDLFGNPAKAQTEALKAEIAKLGEQIDKFHTDMTKRFDRVDRALEQIYSTLQTRFDELQQKLDEVDGNVKAIFDGLIVEQGKLDQLQERLYNSIKDVSNRDLWASVNTAIGWRTRSVGGTPMPQTDFLQYAGLFESWTVQSAYDNVALVPDPRSFSDDDLLAEMSHPLEGNVDYLRRYGAERFGLPALGGDKLPNPTDWSVAARAYSQLLLENPEYMTPGLEDWLGQVREGGLRLRAAIAKVGTRDGGAETGSRTLDAALGAYRARVTEVADAIADVEAGFRAGLKGPDGTPLNVDLRGGPDQAPDAKPSIGAECSARALSLPSNATLDQMVPNAFLVGRRLGLGDVKVCASASYVNTSSSVKNMPNGNTVISQKGALQGKLTWTWTPADGSPALTIAARTYTGPVTTLCSTGYDNEGNVTSDTCEDLRAAISVMAGSWDQTYKPAFESSSSVASDAGTLATVRGAVATKLVALQKDLYGRVAQAFATPSSALAQKAKRLTGAKALIDGYVQLGLPESYINDTDLHALLAGSDRLLDEDAAHRLYVFYAEAQASPPASDPRPALLAEMGARVDRLGARLKADLPASGGERSDLVESTLARLSLTRYVLTGPRDAPAPGGDDDQGGDHGGGDHGAPGGPGGEPHDGGGTPAPVPDGGGATTGGASQQPGGAAGGGRGSADPRPTVVRVTRVGKASMKAIVRSGLPVTVATTGTGKVSVDLVLNAKAAKRLHLGNGRRSVVVGHGSARVAKAGTIKVVVKLTATAKKRLRTAKATTLTVKVALGRATATKTIKTTH